MGMGEVGLTWQCVRTGVGGLLWVATAGSTKCGVLSHTGCVPQSTGLVTCLQVQGIHPEPSTRPKAPSQLTGTASRDPDWIAVHMGT